MGLDDAVALKEKEGRRDLARIDTDQGNVQVGGQPAQPPK